MGCLYARVKPAYPSTQLCWADISDAHARKTMAFRGSRYPTQGAQGSEVVADPELEAGLAEGSAPAVGGEHDILQLLLKRVRHDQSKWIGKPSANVSSPIPYEALPSTRRKPVIVVGVP